MHIMQARTVPTCVLASCVPHPLRPPFVLNRPQRRRSVTRARRLYVSKPSKLPFKRPTPDTGVPSRHPWLQGHSAILGQRSNPERPESALPPMRQGRRIGRNTHPCSAPIPKEGA
ncbi:MAG TPA: hypothetical protein VIM51_06025 [Desulfosporosinus sp.]